MITLYIEGQWCLTEGNNFRRLSSFQGRVTHNIADGEHYIIEVDVAWTEHKACRGTGENQHSDSFAYCNGCVDGEIEVRTAFLYKATEWQIKSGFADPF